MEAEDQQQPRYCTIYRQQIEEQQTQKIGIAERRLQQATYQLLTEKIYEGCMDDNSVVEEVLNFQDVMNCEKDLFACATRGIRALPADEDYVTANIVNDLGVLEYTADELEVFNSKNETVKKLTH